MCTTSVEQDELVVKKWTCPDVTRHTHCQCKPSQLNQFVAALLARGFVVLVPHYIRAALSGTTSFTIVENCFSFARENLEKLNLKEKCVTVPHCVGIICYDLILFY
jgi:hypothetical protein